MSDLTRIESPPGGTAGPDHPARRLSSLWRRGQGPCVEEFLAAGGVGDPAVVVTVLRVDQRERRRRGQWVPAESYLDAFPAVREDPETAIDLVFGEYLLREQVGDSPTLEEYTRRFPQYADQLKLQVELHRAIEEDHDRPWPATWTEGRTYPPELPRTNPESEFGPRPDIPGYEILEVLGWGGMGVVYRAWQQKLSRMVALKMVQAGAQASPKVLARFRVEAEAVARLKHPNIVQIHEVGQHAGWPFLVLELVDGPNLARSLAGTPQAIARAVELFETLARAIHSAHCHGVIHRDLNPANILLTADGAPKITDFGLAKIVIGGEGLRTQTGELLGTPSYMAPEQAASRHQAIGAATDVYALGAMLYEVLTGRPPFKAESMMETLRQVMADEPVAPSRLRPRLPRDLETICLKCLRKEPAQPYDGAVALADEIKRFREGRPILARRSSAAERLWRWCRRNPGLASANIAAAVLTTILAVVSTIAAWTFHGRRDQIVQQHDQISQDYERIELAEAATRKNLYVALSAQARATRIGRQVGQRFDSWRAVHQAALIARELKLTPDYFDRLRDEAIACLALPDLQLTGENIPTPPGVYCVSFDPTMTRYALRFKDGTIQVRNLTDNREVAHFQARGDRGISAFSFSPDGRYLATNHYPGNALTVWNIDRGMEALIDAGTVSSEGRAARFSRDSRQLALAHDDGDLLVYDLATGKPVRRWRGPGQAGDLAIRPDGARIAVLYDWALQPEIDKQKTPTCRILETETGRLVRSIRLPSHGEWITWSPDGRTLATACTDRKVYHWDAATGTRRASLEGHTNGGVVTAFHPASTLLASNGWEGRLWLWDPVRGRHWLNVVGNAPRDWHFSSDGRIVLAREDHWLTYQVDPALEYRTLAHPASPPIEYGTPSVRHDGRVLAVGTNLGVVLWDLAHGAELAFVPIGQALSIHFEPSGDLLTSGAAGVHAWPIQLDAERSECRIGRPHRLPLLPVHDEMAADRSGRIVAVANDHKAVLSTPERTFEVGPPLDDCRFVAVSPDGEWLATGSHGKNGVHIWRIRDATQVAHPVRDGLGGVRFSPDGKGLMTWHPPCRLWEVATWREAHPIGGYGLGFSPDSRLMVVRDANKLIRLVETETGHTLARLESPDLCSVGAATFSPDGSRLVVSTQDGPAVHVWDLRAIRRHLVEVGLDWDAPAYPKSDPASENEAAPPLSGVVNTPFSLESQSLLQQARALEETGKFGEAIDALGRAVRLSPDHADARNGLAWLLLTAPARLRDPREALEHARRAVELAPDEQMSLNTLGVALYRTGKFAESVETLEKSLAAGKGQFEAFDLLFLAMAHHRLGHRDLARACHDRAAIWMRRQNNLNEQSVKELTAFGAEAEEVLAGQIRELPEEVFAGPR